MQMWTTIFHDCHASSMSASEMAPALFRLKGVASTYLCKVQDEAAHNENRITPQTPKAR